MIHEKLVKKEAKLALIGLGYVGLPIALAFAKKFKVIGFDIVECAPIEGSILSEYTLAKLLYRIIGYLENKS